jgi:hypothetical protein
LPQRGYARPASWPTGGSPPAFLPRRARAARWRAFRVGVEWWGPARVPRPPLAGYDGV